MRRMNIALRYVNRQTNSSAERKFIVFRTINTIYTNVFLASRSLASLTKRASGDMWYITSDGIVTLFMRTSEWVRNKH